MKTNLFSTFIFLISIAIAGCTGSSRKTSQNDNDNNKFPAEMVSFEAYKNNPVFGGTAADTWDNRIRERGYILKEDNIYKMWYTGYNDNISKTKYLGYATSADGINWERHPGNPIFDKKWTEDMFVIKIDNLYYMFAEGDDDIAHLLTSSDGIKWNEEGDLTILTTGGDTIPGPYGTPTVWVENGKWYLFYERDDQGIWLATTNDKLTWANVQDEPVIKMGPEDYDREAVAANQIVKFEERYYLYFHGCKNYKTAKRGDVVTWTSNVAVSEDLINWEKYPGNPLVDDDVSSPILVFDGKKYNMYTMHDKVRIFTGK